MVSRFYYGNKVFIVCCTRNSIGQLVSIETLLSYGYSRWCAVLTIKLERLDAMADLVGNSRHPTDFGLKELLWDSDEDGFWEYFSKFEEESRAELARYPLTFPIPPVGASTSSSTASSATPRPSTSKRDHHYHVL